MRERISGMREEGCEMLRNQVLRPYLLSQLWVLGILCLFLLYIDASIRDDIPCLVGLYS